MSTLAWFTLGAFAWIILSVCAWAVIHGATVIVRRKRLRDANREHDAIVWGVEHLDR